MRHNDAVYVDIYAAEQDAFDFDGNLKPEVAQLMDDELREELHSDTDSGISDDSQFLAVYCEMHFEKFGEAFAWA
jgi:hypothetical protein